MTERTEQVMAEIKERMEGQATEAIKVMENFVDVHTRYGGSFAAEFAAKLKENFGIDISSGNIEPWIIRRKKLLNTVKLNKKHSSF